MNNRQNIEVDVETVYDQPDKDVHVVLVEKKLEELTSEMKETFIKNLANELDTLNPQWFQRLIEYIQIIVPLKKENNRSISLQTKEDLLRVIFSIFPSRENQFDVLNRLFPLYTFKYDDNSINQFYNERLSNSYKKFRITLHPRNKVGFPTVDFLILIHEITHSISGSVSSMQVKALGKKERNYQRLYSSSPIGIFLEEYLSDFTAMLMSNKENPNIIFHKPISSRIFDRINTSLNLYPTLKEYVVSNGWSELENLSRLIPYNLYTIVEISKKIQDILAEVAKETKIKDSNLENYYEEENIMLIDAFTKLLKPIFEEDDYIDSNLDNLDKYQEDLERIGNYKNISFYAEGADMVLGVLNDILKKVNNELR